MTVYEALNLMIGFCMLVATILIVVFTALSAQKKK
ncbi:putative holin-like toxin [Brevibacillus sp. SYP-B805]|nr:putative holin-like toxin [Brevibacillus sp. SYP-B805]